MQWKASSSFAAITSLVLLSAVDVVVAQITAPSCTSTGSWQWSYNSLNQNPCSVAAHLFATCYNGVFDFNPLGLDVGYAGPSLEEVIEADSCWCNTVIYNLMSACSECQGGESISWSQYTDYCTTILPPSTFPNPVPAGTVVPQWALVAISGSNYWSPSTAQLVGDSPEVTPGELINTPAHTPALPSSLPVPTLSTPTHTSVPQITPTIPSSILVPDSTPTIAKSSGNQLNQGVITGGGGVVQVVITIAAITGLVLTLFS